MNAADEQPVARDLRGSYLDPNGGKNRLNDTSSERCFLTGTAEITLNPNTIRVGGSTQGEDMHGSDQQKQGGLDTLNRSLLRVKVSSVGVGEHVQEPKTQTKNDRQVALPDPIRRGKGELEASTSVGKEASDPVKVTPTLMSILPDLEGDRGKSMAMWLKSRGITDLNGERLDVIRQEMINLLQKY